MQAETVDLSGMEEAMLATALGTRWERRPYRNHYCAPSSGVVRDCLVGLVGKGLMTQRGDFFFATEAGAAAIGHKLPED